MHRTEQEQAELIKEISGVNTKKCMKCGKCSASCPAYEEMDIRPHQFVSYVQNGDVNALLEMPFLLCLRGALPQRRKAGQAH